MYCSYRNFNFAFENILYIYIYWVSCNLIKFNNFYTFQFWYLQYIFVALFSIYETKIKNCNNMYVKIIWNKIFLFMICFQKNYQSNTFLSLNEYIFYNWIIVEKNENFKHLNITSRNFIYFHIYSYIIQLRINQIQ